MSRLDDATSAIPAAGERAGDSASAAISFGETAAASLPPSPVATRAGVADGVPAASFEESSVATDPSGAPTRPDGSAAAERVVRTVGVLALAGVGATVWLGLWVTPNAVDYADGTVRLLYLHPPLAWVMYIAYGMATLSSLLYLWPRTRHERFDDLAGASAEVGVVFTGLTLVTGSIWGRTTWGVWWTWDPLLTTTALLFVLYLGYLALRNVPGDQETVARRSAIAGLIAFLDVPIVFFSVSWWRSLHQPPTVDIASRHLYVHGSMAWTLLLGFVSFTLTYVWLVVHRYRLAALRAREEHEGLELALAERWSEAAT